MRRVVVLCVLFAGVACEGSGGATRGGAAPSGGGPQAGAPSLVNKENALTGDPNWRSGHEAFANQVELYLDRVSVKSGTTVKVMVSSNAPHQASWTLYRFGWYGGAGARKIITGGPMTVDTQAPCPMTPATALVRCAWAPTASVTIPADALSGLYAVKITRDDGFMHFAPLVVVDNRQADLLLQASVDTYQAYNAWGGESLYTDASKTMPNGRAVQVSFDRPYAANDGLSDMGRNEVPFAQFLERNGYDVTYTTNVDVALGGINHLSRARAFLSIGHDEYWAGEERDAVEAARDAGIAVLFFGADAVDWKIRYEALAGDAGPRVITCYKGRSKDDPVQGAGVTGLYREAPINRPENALLGAMYASYQVNTYPWVAGDAQSWLLVGTGMQTGDAIPLIVGNEYDRIFANGQEPPGVQVLARSPVVDAKGVQDVAETVSYRAQPSNALVFDAGTIFWSHGLDVFSSVHDPRVERMTANVLKEALELPIPPTVGAPAPTGSPSTPSGAPVPENQPPEDFSH
jgi:hypothetical protein